MQEAAVSLLNDWHTFYGIIGSAAATLTGLMFVVATLIDRIRAPKANETFAAFSTPSVVHYCAAFLVAATLCAPWQVLWNVSLLLGLCGLAGVIYVVIIGWRMRRQRVYQPVLEDWLWHTAFPLVSYTALVVAALVLPDNSAPALFVVGAATVLLLFIGIHNAWDNLTYIALVRTQAEDKPQDQ